MLYPRKTKYQCKKTRTDDIVNIQKCEIDVNKNDVLL